MYHYIVRGNWGKALGSGHSCIKSYFCLSLVCLGLYSDSSNVVLAGYWPVGLQLVAMMRKMGEIAVTVWKKSISGG